MARPGARALALLRRRLGVVPLILRRVLLRVLDLPLPHAQPVLEEALRRLVDDDGCCLVLTTGGTGAAPRDITPEATLAVAEKELPGFGEAMRGVSLQKVPTAILSRQTAVVRGSCLLINLPGSPKAIGECLDAVFAAVPHAVRQVGGPTLETRQERLETDPDPHTR